MNKNLVFGVFAAIVLFGIGALAYIAVERPDATATFAGILATFFATVASFAITIYGLGRLNEKVDVAVKQGNGTLTARDAEIARLNKFIAERGLNPHAEKETSNAAE